MSEIRLAACAAPLRHLQQKSPLSLNNLARGRIIANSRFLTEYYRQIAAKPPHTRRTGHRYTGYRTQLDDALQYYELTGLIPAVS